VFKSINTKDHQRFRIPINFTLSVHNLFVTLNLLQFIFNLNKSLHSCLSSCVGLGQKPPKQKTPVQKTPDKKPPNNKKYKYKLMFFCFIYIFFLCLCLTVWICKIFFIFYNMIQDFFNLCILIHLFLEHEDIINN